MKTCTKCKAEKQLAAFYVKQAKCKDCIGEERAAYRQTDAYQRMRTRTRDKRVARQAALRRQAGALPLEEFKALQQQRREESAARKRVQLRHDAHVKAWRAARPGAGWSHRYRTDPEFNAREKVRARLRKFVADTDLQQHLASEAKRGRWPTKWAALLGYTLNDLVTHLQRTLPKGASWADFIDGALHIDHITPRAMFDLKGIDDVRRCWCLSNLRLLPAVENMRKGARVECLL